MCSAVAAHAVIRGCKNVLHHQSAIFLPEETDYEPFDATFAKCRELVI